MSLENCVGETRSSFVDNLANGDNINNKKLKQFIDCADDNGPRYLLPPQNDDTPEVDDVLETKLDRKFQLDIDKGTLDAIGLHPDGFVKRIMYWDSISKLVAPGGLLVITSCNSSKEELVQEVDNFNQRSFAASQEPECPVNREACRDTPQFCYLDHIRSYPTFMFGGSPAQTNLTISLAAPSGIPNLYPAGVFEEMGSSKTISSFQQGSRSLHLLPKAPKPVLAAGLDTNVSSISQIRVARPPVEGRIKNQLLPRYWPR